MEEVWLGRDAATLEVLMEAASPLTWGQLEGLGELAEQAMVLSQAAGPSQPSMAVVVEPPVVAAT